MSHLLHTFCKLMKVGMLVENPGVHDAILILNRRLAFFSTSFRLNRNV